jgi:hypothetical protein
MGLVPLPELAAVVPNAAECEVLEVGSSLCLFIKAVASADKPRSLILFFPALPKHYRTFTTVL